MKSPFKRWRRVIDSAAIAGATAWIAQIAIFIYLLWSMFFMTDEAFTVLGVIGHTAVLAVFCGLLMLVPVAGISFLPVLFDWWWHDIPFSEIGTIPWTLSFIVFIGLAYLHILTAYFGRKVAKLDEEEAA